MEKLAQKDPTFVWTLAFDTIIRARRKKWQRRQPDPLASVNPQRELLPLSDLSVCHFIVGVGPFCHISPSTVLGRGNYKLRMKILGLGFWFFTQKIKTRGCAYKCIEMGASHFFVLGSYRGSKLVPVALSTWCGLSGSKLSRKKKGRLFSKIKGPFQTGSDVTFLFRSRFGDSMDKNTLKVPLFCGFGGFGNLKAP